MQHVIYILHFFPYSVLLHQSIFALIQLLFYSLNSYSILLFSAEDYTVLNEVDYTAGGNEAESDQICSQVHTIDDQVTEGVEVLNIALQLSTGVSWVTLGDLDNPNWHTAKIVIQDNDGA